MVQSAGNVSGQGRRSLQHHGHLRAWRELLALDGLEEVRHWS